MTSAYNRIVAKALAAYPQPYDVARYDGLQELSKVFRPGQVAFCSLSKLDLDTDGKRSPQITHYEPTHQDQVSIDPEGHWCDSNEIPFYVLPGNWPHGGCALGTVATVFYGGAHVHAIFADKGPSGKYGEASLAVHRALGFERIHDGRIQDVGIDSGVTILIYIGEAMPVPCTFDEVQAKGESLMQGWI